MTHLDPGPRTPDPGLLSHLPPSSKIVVGVSGGVDSMVLLHVLLEEGFKVIVTHVNYRMRGEASDEDERIVRQKCDALGIPLDVYTVSSDWKKQLGNISFQEAARDLRYSFFAEVAEKHDAGFVAVAHHQDDQAETVLMHLMRGSGIEGMAGMPPARSLHPDSSIQLIRPLLQWEKSEIVQYAKANNIEWREDESNSSVDYYRNKIRLQLLPEIKKAFGESAVRNVARTADILRGYAEHTIEPELKDRFEKIMGEGADHCLDIDALLKQPPVWQTRLILEALKRWLPKARYAATIADAIADLATQQVGRRFVLPEGVVWRERNELCFVEDYIDGKKEDEEQFVLSDGHDVELQGGVLQVRVEEWEDNRCLDVGANVCLIDADRVDLPLVLRQWQPGDRMQPFGMSGHKKVSDILTDRKIPSRQRAYTWVIESAGQILWIVGVRSAEHGKVREDTRRVIRLEWVKNP